MLSKEEIKNNINNDWHITFESQKEFRYGLCSFIVDTCQKLNLSYNIASLAMLITNYFYVKNCYFNYNKLTMACAALLLSSKNETSQNKLAEISKEYSIFHNKDLDSEGLHKMKKHIGKYEIILLKELNYNVPDEFPYDYIYIYSDLLYPDNNQEIANLAVKIATDSYFTYANNIHKNYVVALACMVIAAKFLDIPSILDENFRHINNMKKIHKKDMSIEEFNRAMNQYDILSTYFTKENKEESSMAEDDDDYFERKTFAEKLYPGLKIEDLIDCVGIITEFYEDMKEKAQ